MGLYSYPLSYSNIEYKYKYIQVQKFIKLDYYICIH